MVPRGAALRPYHLRGAWSCEWAPPLALPAKSACPRSMPGLLGTLPQARTTCAVRGLASGLRPSRSPPEGAAAPSGPPPSRRAVPCFRPAAYLTHCRAEPSALAGSRSLLGVVCTHRSCRRFLIPDSGKLACGGVASARRNGQGATSGRGPPRLPRLKPDDGTRSQISGGTALASYLGSRGEAPGAGGVGGVRTPPDKTGGVWGASPSSRRGQAAHFPCGAPAPLSLQRCLTSRLGIC